MNLIVPAALFICTLLCTVVAVNGVMGYLQRRHIFDNPNPRSSHVRPTLRGAGLGLLPVLLLAWVVIGIYLAAPEDTVLQSELGWVIFGALILAAVSWSDDLRGLPPVFRLLAQIVSAGLVLWMSPVMAPYFQGLLPPWLDVVAALIIWVWFINLFNFMDGIDGMSGVETAGVGLGLAALAATAAVPQTIGLFGLAAAAVAIGFLRWNWHPAKVFLGDVGSVPLGFLLGWLLLKLAAEGLWAAAIILPLYYMLDATITLLRRAARKEKVWEAHRSHYYQQAVQRGLDHSMVSIAVAINNLLLVGLAVYSVRNPWIALGAALVITVGFLGYFRGGKKE